MTKSKLSEKLKVVLKYTKKEENVDVPTNSLVEEALADIGVSAEEGSLVCTAS